MAKRQRTPEDMDEKNIDTNDDDEQYARGRETNEGGRENLDDEDTDAGTTRSKSTPSMHPKKK